MASTGEAFLKEMMPTIGAWHDKAEELAITTYRLQRALLTDETVHAPGEQRGSISMGELRDEFTTSVRSIAPGVLRQYGYQQPPHDATQVLIDPDDDEELTKLLDATRRDNENQTRVLSRAHGPDGYLKRIEKATDDQTRAEQFEKAGAKLASSMSRIARNGGRGAQEIVRTRDKRAIGYARICTHPGKSGHPCAFCAMLMSRGYTYGSADSATHRGARGSGERYHDNCDCVAEAIFDDEQWQDKRFDRNREYADEWKRVTRGKSAKEARLVWRRYHEGRTRPQAG